MGVMFRKVEKKHAKCYCSADETKARALSKIRRLLLNVGSSFDGARRGSWTSHAPSAGYAARRMICGQSVGMVQSII